MGAFHRNLVVLVLAAALATLGLAAPRAAADTAPGIIPASASTTTPPQPGDVALTANQIANHYAIATTVACAPLSSPYSQAVSSTAGVVSYWRLGEASGSTACDSVGSNPGTYQPGTTLGKPGAIAGDPDTSVGFDGSTGSVSVPSASTLNLGDRFTIEAWVKRQRTGVTEIIVSKQQGSWLLEFNGANQLTLRRSTVADVVSSTATVTDTAWHYVAATKDGSNVHLYIDGHDVTGPVLSPQTMVDNTQPLVIGESINSSYLKGTIDDLAVYNVALTANQIANHYAMGATGTVPSEPVNTSAPTVSGNARSGQTLSATTGIWTGAAPIAYLYQWQRCNSSGGGCQNVNGPTASSTYTLGATDAGSTLRVSVAASNSAGSASAVSAVTPLVSNDPVVVAVGDIACAPGDKTNGCQQGETAALTAAQSPSAVLTAGDNQYNSGLLSEFLGSGAYNATWGQFGSIVHPAPGNHEYAQSSTAAGYFGYFGSAAGNGAGYYSFDIGKWHIVSLNSSCSSSGCQDSAMGQTSATQTSWLQTDLATHQNSCTLAYWHHPRFSSGWNSDSPGVGPLWTALYNAHADIVLNGHDHIYERYALQSPTATATTSGIREFVVGTGGENLQGLDSHEPNLQAFDTNDYGVLVLTLHASSYDWAFKRTNGTIVDSGSDTCHGRNNGSPATGTALATGAGLAHSRAVHSVRGSGPVGPALAFNARLPLAASVATVARRGLPVAIELSRGADIGITVALRRGRRLVRIASFRETDEEISRPHTVISLRLPARQLQDRRNLTLVLRFDARDAFGRHRVVRRTITLGR
jgi:Concanavalin A-like lectin/glucanases superfamily/Calcineurin-like phosphoesterase